MSKDRPHRKTRSEGLLGADKEESTPENGLTGNIEASRDAPNRIDRGTRPSGFRSRFRRHPLSLAPVVCRVVQRADGQAEHNPRKRHLQLAQRLLRGLVEPPAEPPHPVHRRSDHGGAAGAHARGHLDGLDPFLTCSVLQSLGTKPWDCDESNHCCCGA